jgi:hypothetical protein
MPRFCGKHDIVEAVQFDGDNWPEVKALVGTAVHNDAKQLLKIYDGNRNAEIFDLLPGHWVSMDGRGRIRCFRADAFEHLYMRIWREEPEPDRDHEAYAVMCTHDAVIDIKTCIAHVRGCLDFIEDNHSAPNQGGTCRATLSKAVDDLLNITKSLAIMRAVQPLLPKAAGEKEAGDDAD